jgi:hypothetical protein
MAARRIAAAPLLLLEEAASPVASAPERSARSSPRAPSPNRARSRARAGTRPRRPRVGAVVLEDRRAAQLERGRRGPRSHAARAGEPLLQLVVRFARIEHASICSRARRRRPSTRRAEHRDRARRGRRAVRADSRLEQRREPRRAALVSASCSSAGQSIAASWRAARRRGPRALDVARIDLERARERALGLVGVPSDACSARCACGSRLLRGLEQRSSASSVATSCAS